MKRSEIKELPNLSLYRFENYLNVYQESNGLYFYNLLKSVNIYQSKDERINEEYTIVTSDSWTGLSYKFYNTIELWWFICCYNQIDNPLESPEPGLKIKILKPEYIGKILSELRKK